jgi:hypothetical protein
MYAELEIGIRRALDGGHDVTLRFNNPAAENEIRPETGRFGLDPAALLEATLDPDGYGKALAAQLFHDPRLLAFYGQAKAAVEAGDLRLRLRLLVDPSAAELHAVRWELLADPLSGAPLATSEKVVFSRFMWSRDWRPARRRRKEALSALIAVAEPSDLAKYRLAGGYLDRCIADAKTSLSGLGEVPVLGKNEPVTLDRLAARLREGVDVLYLVCHGVLDKEGPRLFLQCETGEAKVTSGADLALRISELRAPLLVVLASCESAGSERASAPEASAQASLAPLLAEVGVQAVVAMQGRVTVDTIQKAMPLFFSELLKDGQIDRAMAVARGAVRDRPDFWMPALFLRLKGGGIWYEPRFAGEGNQFERWKALCFEAHQGKLIPIIGSDVSEWIFGTMAELANRLADQSAFPMAHRDRSNLARVSQYLSISQSPQYARSAVLQDLHAQAVGRSALGGETTGVELQQLLDVVAKQRRDSDPCRMLAELDAPIYITASIETSLLKALKAAGKEPQPLVCKWRPTADNHPSEPRYEGTPTPQKPIVYHVFGVIGEPDSLVLTEDDFFDYLIATAKYKLIPTVVSGSLTASSLIFLGFALDDWAFRVLFRMIMTIEGKSAIEKLPHVGVQVDPDEQDLADVQRARRYLERYFVTDTRAGEGRREPPIDLYWGSGQDFLTEFLRQLKRPENRRAAGAVKTSREGWFS